MKFLECWKTIMTGGIIRKINLDGIKLFCNPEPSDGYYETIVVVGYWVGVY